ncbi:MAG: retropepsin-like aspartic protease [Sphingomonas sp.]
MSKILVRCIALFVTALIPVGSALHAQDAPAEAPAEPEVINLYLSETRALVMLRVGDAAPVPVVFDTGTNGNLVDAGLADRLGLPNTGPSPSVDGSTGKPVPGHDSFIRGARLGGVAIRDARATVLAYDLPDEVGIFGPNSFPESLVEMDGPRSRLTIRRKADATLPPGPATPYLGSGGSALPSAILEFDGLSVPAILDTGNDSSIILPLSFKDRLKLDQPPRLYGYAVSAAGRQPIYVARLVGTVRIEGVAIENPEIRFMEGGRPNIGLPVLRRITVVYDHGGSRSWILSKGTIAP